MNLQANLQVEMVTNSTSRKVSLNQMEASKPTVQIPGYEILDLIYNGSSTSVYRALSSSDRQPVVIKLLHDRYPTANELEKFRHQYTIAEYLKGLPGIVNILTLQPYSNGLALIMVDDGLISLAEYIYEYPLDVPKFLTVATAIVQIIDGLHRRQIIHRDIKPQNLLIEPITLAIQLIDFSISVRLSDQVILHHQNKGLEGTPAYIAPEQTGRINRGVDHRTDFYSLGVTFYQLLTGKLPFKYNNPMSFIHAHIAKKPQPPHVIKPEIPLIISDIIMKLMAKNPEDRYQNAWGIYMDLVAAKTQWEIDYQQTIKLGVPYSNSPYNLIKFRSVELTENLSLDPQMQSEVDQKLQRLNPLTQRLLQQAACLGDEFASDILLSASQLSPGQMGEVLDEAIAANLIELVTANCYGFVNPSIRVAAYHQILPHQRPAIHLELGRRLYPYLTAQPSDSQEKILHFLVVNQLNLGVELMGEQWERDRLAELNLTAGFWAVEKQNYPHAIGYLMVGIGLIGVEGWTRQYELTLALYTQAARVAYLVGNGEQMSQWCDRILAEAKTLADQVTAWELKILVDLDQNKSQTPIINTLNLCQQLGVEIPLVPGEDILQQARVKFLSLSNLEPDNYPRELSPNSPANQTRRAAVNLLSLIWEASRRYYPQMSQLIGWELVNLSVELGISDRLAVAYAATGLILTESGDLDRGYAYGKLALKWLDKLDFIPLKSKVLEWVNQGIRPRCESLANWRSSLPAEQLPRLAYLTGVDNGSLTPTEAINTLKGTLTLEEWLGNSSPERLTFNDYLDRLMVAYILRDFPRGWEYAQLARNHVNNVICVVSKALFYAYDSLIQLAINPPPLEVGETVRNNQDIIESFCVSAPQNFRHLWQLVEAEKYRVLGNRIQGIEAYDRAIELAQKHGHKRELAVANERAALFYLDWERHKIARTYLIDAYYGYANWQASAKIKLLESGHFSLLKPILYHHKSEYLGATETIISSSTGSNVLDLSTTITAAQALSGEIDLKKLLSKLMQVLLETAGAQKCCIILGDRLSNLAIEGVAICDMISTSNSTKKTPGKIQVISVLESIPVTMTQQLSQGIIELVMSTEKPVIFDNVSRDFIKPEDEYLQDNQLLSLLCMPIHHRGDLVGVLYLENNLIYGAFTSERLQILNVLFSQAAISIGNARLYSKMREGERRMTQFLEGMPVGVAVVDSVGKLQYINQQAKNLLNQKLKLGDICDDFLPLLQPLVDSSPDSPNAVDIDQEQRAIANFLEINQGDKLIPIESWVTPYYDQEGDLVYAIIAFQDITEQQQREIALREAEERYRSIFENALDGLFQSTPDGKFIRANPAMARILGYNSPEDVINICEDISQQIYVNPDDRITFERLIREQGEVSNFECQFYRQDGTKIWISETARAVRNQSGDLLYYEGLLEDITSRKIAEKERLELLNELSELNQNLDKALDAEFEMTDAAGRFVPHQFLSCLGYESLVEVQLGTAVQKEMSILFSDIRDFTSLSEGMTPEDSFKFINAFLSRMEPEILDNYGFIDKYIGDGIMALFGEKPDHAVQAGIAMLKQLSEYNLTRSRPGRRPIRIGVGIHTGTLMLGTVGGRNRMDSTVIGDAVNLAARIESLTKNYSVSFLITHQTFMGLDDPNQYAFRIIDRVKVKGKTDAVTVYEFFDADPPELHAKKLATKVLFERSLFLYYLNHTLEAKQGFHDCLSQNPNDMVARIYLNRCWEKLRLS
ncbi:PAS domain S-box protein [Limnospira fusiformis KN01]|uniref:Ser/Thr protein kinase with PAS, GAF and adenylate cyclase domain n=2 Tax=Limnospira TaxID=2596745 RepID=A0A9P1KKQ2_9CYAN|nr:MULTISPECIES: adenylate/guanylate cyclase domain-containing protein [Limnospira]MDY7051814.1 adenylate/guanylate cyclase domain-containing protein [Limnospira fusiformis LS22]MDT9186256.1 adenylate/guanylate cyclase domain-containing protein [Limnospira sp. PMC 894.15]MDT9196473.1 adenylate/guanylate cyclase domain-containing protein [Limnospira sp. PMC 1042.18]ULB45817.1 PAS domain S-box protein [Limnospira fusiformis KN01]CDM98077.1 Ser/Thr protein kinase with PAS, GAF and adenylate cycla